MIWKLLGGFSTEATPARHPMEREKCRACLSFLEANFTIFVHVSFAGIISTNTKISETKHDPENAYIFQKNISFYPRN